MSEQLLHGPQVGSAFQQMSSVRVPEGMGVQSLPIGQRMTLQDAASIPRTEPSAPLIQENRAPWGLVGFEEPAAVPGPAFDGDRGWIAERHPANFGAFSEHREQIPAQIEVGGIKAAAFRHPDPRPVEQLEDREITQGHGVGDAVSLAIAVFVIAILVAVRDFVIGNVMTGNVMTGNRGAGRGGRRINHRGRLRDPGHSRKTAWPFR